MTKRTLELIVAEGCNLKCAYCFEHFKTPTRMDFETAKAAIDHYMTDDDGYDEVLIDFMGGEPMIAFPLIKKVVAYVESKTWPKRYHFSMSTNGTLFKDAYKPWFVAHREVFTPMVSLDGTKLIHDLNRSNSYDRIIKNIDFLRENWPFQSLKMTVNHLALPYLADGIFSILALGFPIEVNLIHDDVWGTGETLKTHRRILEYELARLVDFYTEYPTLEAPRLVNLPIVNTLIPDRDPHKAWCGAGEAMVAVDNDGNRYPCHRFMQFSAGKAMSLDDYHNPEINRVVDSPCDACPMVAACPTCAAHNWEHTGSITDRTVHNCELLKLQMVATAALHVNRLALVFDGRSVDEINDEDLATMGQRLQAARHTFDVLADSPQAELKPYITGEWPFGAGWETRTRWHERRDHTAPSEATDFIPLEVLAEA